MSAQHQDHEHCLTWYESLAAGGAGICRLTQITVLRLMCTRAVMGSASLSAGVAWLRMEELFEDERVEFLEEPAGLNAIWPTLFRYREPAPNLVNDAYLAAFAIAGGHKLVTLDRGFLEFRGLDVEILA